MKPYINHPTIRRYEFTAEFDICFHYVNKENGIGNRHIIDYLLNQAHERCFMNQRISHSISWMLFNIGLNNFVCLKKKHKRKRGIFHHLEVVFQKLFAYFRILQWSDEWKSVNSRRILHLEFQASAIPSSAEWA